MFSDSERRWMPPVARSYLYVPASEPRMIEKALASPADAVVLDLEDAVPADRKLAARQTAAAVIRERPPKILYVRINGLASSLAPDDVATVATAAAEADPVAPGATGADQTSTMVRVMPQCGLVGLRVPKMEQPDDVAKVRQWIDTFGCGAGVVPLIETALGVERALAIARSDASVLTLAMGEADLRADLRASADEALDYARARCVLAARAARCASAIQSVHTSLSDDPGLRTTTERGRTMGFGGRSAIHPAQVSVINEVFTPTDEERTWAAGVVATFDAARARGEAATTYDGQFVDEPVARYAATVLATADLTAP